MHFTTQASSSRGVLTRSTACGQEPAGLSRAPRAQYRPFCKEFGRVRAYFEGSMKRYPSSKGFVVLYTSGKHRRRITNGRRVVALHSGVCAAGASRMKPAEWQLIVGA